MKDAKDKPQTSDTKVFSFCGNIFQSEGELKIQKQNRIRNMIRSRIEKERRTVDKINLIQSDLLNTDRFNNADQLNKENYGISEIKGQCFNETQNRQYETKNVPELQLEQDRNIAENLEEVTQCHLVLNKEIIQGAAAEEKENRDTLKETKDKHSLTISDTKHSDSKNTSDLNPTEDGILILDGKS